MASYESLGVQRIVNASANNSKAGSSCLSSEVIVAMGEASRWYIDMDELHAKCGEFIAKITGAEAGLVTSGACGGLLIAAAACITRLDIGKMMDLPESSGASEIIVQKGHRSGYDMAVKLSGAKLVEVGLPFRTYPQQIENAINRNTVGILYTIGEFISSKGEVPLQEVIRIGKEHQIPVILDGALIIYPFNRLREYIAMGVDLLVTSGGKHVFGPPGTGFLCGKKDLVEACRLQAGPAFGIGRPLKIGKEQMIGLITALELYLKKDEAKEICEWREKARIIHQALNHFPHLTAEITEMDEVGRPVPRVRVKIDEMSLGLNAFNLSQRLRKEPPYIWVQEFILDEGVIWINPVCLQEGDEERIISGFKTIWEKLGLL